MKNLLVPVMISLCTFVTLAADEDYPLRAKYPSVEVITTPDLLAQFDQFVVVDVRAVVEYEVCKINGATNIPVTQGGFDKKLQQLRGKEEAQALVFYCNGHTCSKSYKAWIAADKAGFKNILCYDGGIFDWITAAPDKATLLGKTPADPADIIPKPVFKELCLAKDAFLTAAQGGLVIDIREPLQRKEYEGVTKSRNIPFTRLVKLIEEGKMKDKQLFIYDSVGKQVRWLHYHLKTHNYQNFKFLAGGAKALK